MNKLLLCLLISGCAGTYRLHERNDALTPFNSDEEYTQGLEFQYNDGQNEYSLGQDIYTPRDKSASERVKGERPYAGYLYGRFEQSRILTDEADWYWGVEAGILGPRAGGKDTQCTVHDWLGQACPNGWRHQLPERFLVTAIMGARVERPFELYITSPYISHDLRIEAGNKSIALVTSHLLEWSFKHFDVYSGPRIHLVGYDVFLDSDVERRALDVKKNVWFAEYILGTRAYYLDFSIGLELSLITPQYEAARGNYGFGQLTLEYKY